MWRGLGEQLTPLSVPVNGVAAKREEYEPQKISEIHQSGPPERFLEHGLRIVRCPSEWWIDQPFPSPECANDENCSNGAKAGVEEEPVDAIEELSVSHLRTAPWFNPGAGIGGGTWRIWTSHSRHFRRPASSRQSLTISGSLSVTDPRFGIDCSPTHKIMSAQITNC